jgi:hypothetical protein
MVDSGGWLDEVHWVQNTDRTADLEYLDEILLSSPRYKKIDLSSEGIGFDGYANAWRHLERGKLYLKIDDDVVRAIRKTFGCFFVLMILRSGSPTILFRAW